ncbi:MAG: hypothetical protein J5I47_07125 [Vicingus serpentipes]|nr:hypothetical protein [Vicingus serpentipes]
MKKIFPLIILLITISTAAFSQSSKKEMLTKKWKVTELEEFGSKYELDDNRKDDWMEFNSDGTFTGLIYNGHVEGTWNATETKVSISTNKKTSKTTINWIKVKTVEVEKLVFTYQDGDLIQATLTLVPFSE